MQAISLDEDNFPVLQSPARPKQASFLHRATPDKAAEGLHERPRSPVSTLNQAPSATPSPAPTSAADLHSGHVTPIKATATSTCSDTGTDASAPHQAPEAAASTCSEGEEALAAPAPEAAREAHPGDGEFRDDSISSDKTAAAEGAAAEEPAAAAADGEAAPQTQGESGDMLLHTHVQANICQHASPNRQHLRHLVHMCKEQDRMGHLAIPTGLKRSLNHSMRLSNSCRWCRAKGGSSPEALCAGRGACRVCMGPQQQAAL